MKPRPEKRIGCSFKNKRSGMMHKVTGVLDDSYMTCSGVKLVIDNTDTKESKRAGNALMWIGAHSFERALEDKLIELF